MGVSSGPGWGGPAKGPGVGPAKPFTADSPTRRTIPGGIGDPAKKLTREEKAARDEDRAEQYRQIIHTIATDPEAALNLRLIAAEKGLDRIEGKPMQKSQVTGADGGAIATEVVYRWAEPDKE